MNGFSDIHSHFIYGVDDGAKTRNDMEVMLDAAYADGIASLYATPHITPGVRFFDFASYLRRYDEACAYCRERGYAMTLYTGAEILYTPALQDYIVNHRLPTLADSKLVLMEFVPDVTPRELTSALDLMERYGYITVLAHIERYACFLHGSTARKVKGCYEVRYQMNANTVLDNRGFLRTRRIQSWFQEELVDFVASDAHDANIRPYQMKRAYAELKQKYGGSYAARLTGMQENETVIAGVDKRCTSTR